MQSFAVTFLVRNRCALVCRKGFAFSPIALALSALCFFAMTGCGGAGPSVANSSSSPPPAALLTVNPSTIQQSQSTTLSWQTSNATSVTIEGVGTVAANGSMLVTPTATTTYQLTATGAGGKTTTTAMVTVNIPAPPPPAPTASLSAKPNAIQGGQSSTLTWQTTNASSVTIDGLGAVGTSGSQSVTPTETTIYKLTATGDGGSTTASTQVTVETPPPPPPPSVLIPASFFGMTIGDQAAYPPATVPIGALGHPTLLAWAEIEPQRGSYDFSFYDKFANWASGNGIPFMITFAWTPSWAVADQSSCIGVICTAPPDHVQDWTDFLTTVINHYNGVTAPHVKYYEVWNEANSAIFWTGTHPQLVGLAAAAYPVIHQDPGAMLLAPSVTGPLASAQSWLDAYFGAGGNQYADGASFHGYIGPAGESPYPFPEDNDSFGYTDIVTRATSFRATFDNDGLAGKPMFDSEGSWGKDNVTDPDQQVAWLSRWFLLQAGLLQNGAGLVSSAYWFSWGDSTPGAGSDQQWGLISDDGGLTPTAAGIAYGQLFNWLAGASVSKCQSSAAPPASSLWTCMMSRSGGYHAMAAWYYSASESETTLYTPPAQFLQYRDLAGNTHTMNGAVTVGPQPILLETGTP